MPGLCSGSKRTWVSLSVTARLNFFWMTSGVSMRKTQPSGSDLLILLEGSPRLITRAPILGMKGSGRVKVSLYTPLKRWATSRHSSTCCFWS